MNFVVWWYLVEARIFISKVFGYWIYMMQFLNILPMLTNLFTPLYQDYTKLGRIIAFPIRSTWAFMGIVIQLILIPPMVLMIILYVLMPLAPIWGVFSYLANM